jgi:hypothetical protein
MAPDLASQFLRVDTVTDNFTTWTGDELSVSTKFVGRPFVSCNFDGELMWYIPYESERWLTLNTSKDFDATLGPPSSQWPSAGGTASFGVGRFVGSVFDGPRVWMVANAANAVLIVQCRPPFNMTAVVVPSSANNYIGGVFDGQRVWLMPAAQTSLVFIDIITLVVVSVIDPWPTPFVRGEFFFGGGTVDGRNLWLVLHVQRRRRRRHQEWRWFGHGLGHDGVSLGGTIGKQRLRWCLLRWAPHLDGTCRRHHQCVNRFG